MFTFPWSKKKESEKPMPERVKQAAAVLPDSIKNMSTQDLARKINMMNRPNKWAITRRAAQGMQKGIFVGGNHYPPYTSEKLRQKRLRQIAKGMIQVTPDDKQLTQEAT